MMYLKKKILLLFITLIIFSLVPGCIQSQNGFLSGDGWGIGWSTTDYWNGTGYGTTFGKTYQNSSGTGNRYFRLYTDWNSQQRTHGPAGNSDIQVVLNSPISLQTWGASGKAYYINVTGGATNYRYVFRTKYGDGITNTPQLIVFEVQGAIRNITNVSQSPLASNVGPSSPVTVTAVTDENLNTGQSIYVRYTTDNWTNSSIIEMSGSSTSYTALIPTQSAGTNVNYYIFTSGPGLSIAPENADWYTINGNTNGGSNYSYTVLSGAITVIPSFPTDDVTVTITFDASGTALAGASKVYLHSGVSTNPASPTSFDYTIGNWGQDDGVGEMTNTGGDNWQFVVTPGLRTFYAVPEYKDIFGLNFLFRNVPGNIKVDNNSLNYYNPVDPGNYFSITFPTDPIYFGEVGQPLVQTALANTAPTSWTLTEIDTLTGSFISTLTSQNGNINFSHSINISNTTLRKFKLEADFSGTTKYKTFYLKGYNPVTEEPRPAWTKPGINYHTSDPEKVTLVLHAPTYTIYKKGNGTISGSNSTTSKKVVFILGDFNNWTASESYKMKRDSDGWDGTTDADGDDDHGDYWWLELSGLNPGQEYVFQYLIDGNLQVADPYTNKVSDPDDQFIAQSVYPDLILYRPQASDRASVFQTDQQEYNWTADVFSKPSINDLNVYELHFRDFTEEGTYLSAIERLDYIKGMGINAIHVMPVSEFEGNSSWGYNPNFYFAPDKAYGTSTDLKKFIDECHKREIEVFNDMVLNHAFYSNVMAKMYWNSSMNRPADDNPWFNPEHKMIFDPNGHWGADWNHESVHTQEMVDRILDHWIQEYHFDGFRFDFTKGFGQTAPDPGDTWAGSYDQDRIDLLLRMANGLKSRNPGSVVIFEHLADYDEERYLAGEAILMWSGVGHHNSVKNFILGWNGDDTNIYSNGVYNSPAKGFTYANLISYAESHDEQRLGFEVKSYFNWGAFTGPKSTGADSLAAIIDRLKIAIGFNLLFPGPRMLWEFQELGYDIDIDFNGRTGEKPVKWEYYDDLKRRELYTLASKILKLRNFYDLYSTTPDYGNIGLGSGNLTTPRVMRISTDNNKHVIIVANLDPATGHDVYPEYDVTGTWYKYNGDPSIDGSSFEVTNTGSAYSLGVSEMLIFTNFEIDKCTDVRSAADSGEYTLRGAIECAQEGGTINFEFPVFGDTINLLTPIIIDKDITICGFTSKNVTVSGADFAGSVFSIASGKTVSIDGLKINCSQGGGDGRCLVNSGVLTLDNLEINDKNGLSTGSSVLNTEFGSMTIYNNVDVKK